MEGSQAQNFLTDPRKLWMRLSFIMPHVSVQTLINTLDKTHIGLQSCTIVHTASFRFTWTNYLSEGFGENFYKPDVPDMLLMVYVSAAKENAAKQQQNENICSEESHAAAASRSIHSPIA